MAAQFSISQQGKRSTEFVRCLNDPFASFGTLANFFSGSSKKGCFVLCNAGTRVSDHEGISAAGSDPLARRLTPALDAEALVSGKTVSSETLPVSPKGIVSPVVISRACLQLLGVDIKVVDCGSFHTPQGIDVLKFSDVVANCSSSGKALDLKLVSELFQNGQELGKDLAESSDYLMLAECVPGGTTTAMSVLSALGYEVQGLMSSSLPNCNHSQKWKLVEQGLKNAGLSIKEFLAQPLQAVASVGDGMQAVVAGIASTASPQIPVFLAGGSQMLAVWSLLNSMYEHAEERSRYFPQIGNSNWRRNTHVITTKWVAFDPAASVVQLARLVDGPLLASCPDFTKSQHAGLQAYEEGNVKEGVGAGASMCLSHLSGFDFEQIMQAIDNCYDELVAMPV